jgi:hypothetical protein
MTGRPLLIRLANSTEAVAEPDSQAVFTLQPPAEASRRQRWERVLSWYLPPNDAVVLPTVDARTAASHPIAMIGGACAEVKQYALLTGGRPVVKADSLSALAAELGHSTPAVTVVASPVLLTVRELRAFVRRTGILPAVITGRDQAAVGFMLAKQLLLHAGLPKGLRARATLDELGDAAAFMASMGPAERTGFGSDAVQRVLAGDWRGLLLHVHGEGSHANLRSAVLCGVDEGAERIGGREVTDGCAPTSRRCKRSGGADGNVYSFHMLRTAELIFLSCNGFSVAGEEYPSDNSAILSLVEGYTAQIVCNDRSVPTGPEQVTAAFTASAGISPKALAEILNEAYSDGATGIPAEPGTHPWLLVGDALVGETPSGPAFDGKIKRCVNVCPASVYTEAGEGSRIVFATSASLVVADSDPETEIREDRNSNPRFATADLAAQVSAVELTLRHALCLDLLLDAVADRLGDGELPPGTWEQLRVANGYLRAACGRARQRLKLAVTSRVAGPKTEEAQMVMDQISAVWSSLLATAIAESLEQGLEEVIPALAERFTSATRDACDRCDNLVTEYRGESAIGEVVPLSWSTCPTCGLRDSYWGRPAGMQVSLPRRWERHTALEIDLTSNRDLSSGHLSWTCASLRDKARGVQIFELSLTKGLPERIQIPAPEKLSPDLHTVRLARVQAQSFSIHRRRVPYLT